MTRRHAVSLAFAGACLYSTILGGLVGITVERIRFSAERASALSRLALAEHRVRARLMDLEKQAESPARAEP